MDELLLAEVPETCLVADVGGSIFPVEEDEWVVGFLKLYEGHTVRLYEREIRRFRTYLLQETKRSLRTMTIGDVDAYLAFLKNPPAHWVGPRKAIHDPGYRFLQGPLSGKSLHAARSVLNSFTGFLQNREHIAAMPRAKRFGSREEKDDTLGAKLLSRPAVDLIFQAALQGNSPERDRFLITLFYRTACRLSDPCINDTATFRAKVLPSGREQWVWYPEGKGKKTEGLELHPEVMEAFADYRASRNLPRLPYNREANEPIVLSLRTHQKITANGLWRILTDIFKRAARLDHDGPCRRQLMEATPHWLRHTGLTRLLQEGWPLEKVQKLARHANMATTHIYVKLAASEESETEWSPPMLSAERIRAAKEAQEGGGKSRSRRCR